MSVHEHIVIKTKWVLLSFAPNCRKRDNLQPPFYHSLVLSLTNPCISFYKAPCPLWYTIRDTLPFTYKANHSPYSPEGDDDIQVAHLEICRSSLVEIERNALYKSDSRKCLPPWRNQISLRHPAENLNQIFWNILHPVGTCAAAAVCMPHRDIIWSSAIRYSYCSVRAKLFRIKLQNCKL